MRAEIIRMTGILLMGSLLAAFALAMLSYVGVLPCLRDIYHQPYGIEFLVIPPFAGCITGMIGSGVGGFLVLRYAQQIAPEESVEQRLRAGIRDGAFAGWAVGYSFALGLFAALLRQ